MRWGTKLLQVAANNGAKFSVGRNPGTGRWISWGTPSDKNLGEPSVCEELISGQAPFSGAFALGNVSRRTLQPVFVCKKAMYRGEGGRCCLGVRLRVSMELLETNSRPFSVCAPRAQPSEEARAGEGCR